VRKGIDGLAMLVQGVLRQNPFTGHLFVFRGRTRANLIKIVFWDGAGLCLFTKRLEHGVFLWPQSVEPGETFDVGAAVVADRRGRLARTGTTVASGRSGIIAATD
jgi:transposase